MKKQVWIGLVTLEPRPGNNLLADAKGACVHVLALVCNKSEYEYMVKGVSNRHNFDVIEIKDVIPYNTKKKYYTMNKELDSLAKKVERTGVVYFGTFFCYGNMKRARVSEKNGKKRPKRIKKI